MNSTEYTTRMVKMKGTQPLWLVKSTVDLSSPEYVHAVHWHDFFEMEFVMRGRAIHILNGKAYPVKQGSFYLLTPADLHTLIPDPDCEDTKITVLNIMFPDTMISDSSVAEFQTLMPPLTAEASGNDLADCLDLAQRLVNEKNADGPHSKDILHHTFFAFLYKFLRLYHMQHGSHSAETVHSAVDRELTYIRNAIAYIRYNFRDPTISIAKIASAVCLSPNYFGTIFKKHMNENCLSYIRNMRLKYANVLLQSAQLTIAEIAEKCGYSTIPYFISDYRQAYGMPPKKHRDNINEEKHIAKGDFYAYLTVAEQEKDSAEQ